MSQHPSLKSDKTGSKFRSVLKRYERIKELSEKEKWDEEEDSIYHLPKLKRIRFKVKKAKPAPTEEGAEGAAITEEGAAKPAAGAAGEAATGDKDKAAPADGEKKK